VDRRDLEVLKDHWGQEVIDPALVAHWRLDENQGQIAQDSARDHDGALHGAPVWQPAGGMRDGALQLDGIDDYVSAASALDPAHGSFSVFLWVRGGAPGQVILSQADGANWLMLAPEGALMTELKQAGRSGKPLTSAAVVADGAWHHVALVWDGANRSLYVDDVEVAQDNVLLIVPALVGSEGAPAPFNPIGICTFFRNELCEIHQIKPIEGKIVSHDNISDKHGVHKRIALSWDTEEGKQLVKEWKEIVGCDEDINDPTSIIDMFDFVLETLKRGFLKR
jgi:hypothetical protein